ncbi:hypothetical protein H9P43_001464 [Blastocladiella emersonii ATCC 22665]|nr:hypothetical protein H9P43_001464 [Blastocladiella emersonii ATCC 22665]
MGNTDSKLAFRQNLFRLVREDVPRSDPANAAFYAQFWTLPTSPDDVFTLLQPMDVRRLREDRPTGFAALWLAVVDRLLELVADPSWTAPAQSLVSAITTRGGSARAAPASGPANDPAKCLAALNCVRLLTRLLPYLYEAEAPDDGSGAVGSPLEMALLYRPVQTTADAAARAEGSVEGGDPAAVPLAHVLLVATVKLLFRPGFTTPLRPPADAAAAGLPPAAVAADSLAEQVWDASTGGDGGAESAAKVVTPTNMNANRTEVLRLLLVLLSKAMFVAGPASTEPAAALTASLPASPMSPASTTTAGSMPSTPIPTPTTTTSTPSSLSFGQRSPLTAYMTGADFPPSLARALVCSLLNTLVAWSPAGWMPYDYLVLASSGDATLATLCIHVLCVLLTAPAGDESAPGAWGAASPNQFHRLIAQMSPDSAIATAPALAFYSVIDGTDLCDTLVDELLDLLTQYQNPQEVNLIRIALQVLLSLSLRECTRTEEIIATVHGLMTQPLAHLAPFYEQFLSLLRRCAYFHPITAQSATRLVQLASVLGQPRYLTRGEHNHRLATAVFEILEYALALESREVLDAVMSHPRELGAFLYVQLADVEPRVVGKGKTRRRADAAWTPNAAWFDAWRAELHLPQLVHAVASIIDAPVATSLEDLGAVLSTLPKTPPKSVLAVGAAGTPRTPPSAPLPPAVRAWLPGFVWGAAFLRHKPGEKTLALWQGTAPRLFKVRVVTAAQQAAAAGAVSAPASPAPSSASSTGLAPATVGEGTVQEI